MKATPNKIIHLRHGDHTACGRYISSRGDHGMTLTANASLINCKVCLRVHQKDEYPAGEPTRVDDGIPVFRVKAEGCFDEFDGPRGCHLVFRCPKCGRLNRHGGYFGNPGAADGHRIGHCECWPKDYYIEEETMRAAS